MIATITQPAFLDSTAACRRLGISPALLRLWESRYGWPCPRRTSTGQRRFTLAEIAEIEVILALVRGGTPIGSLVADGRPHLPTREPVAQRSPVGEEAVAGLGEPGCPQAARLRAELVAALRRRDGGEAARLLHAVLWVCRPTDRALAAWLPALALIEAWDRLGRPLAESETLRSLIGALGGIEVLVGA